MKGDGIFNGDPNARQPCNICRDSDPTDPFLMNPNSTIAMFNGTSLTCQEAQNEAFQFGSNTGYNIDQCLAAQALAAADDRCGCPGVTTGPPVPVGAPTPVASPSPAVTSPPTPSVDDEKVFCFLCLSDRRATQNGFIADRQCGVVTTFCYLSRTSFFRVDCCVVDSEKASVGKSHR